MILSPQVIALAPGGTATITAQCYSATPGLAVTASSNNTNVATVSGSGVTPGPLTFTVTATANALGSALITFTVATDAPDSGAGVPICIVPQNAGVPQGRTYAQALATVRRRTNLNFGQPADADILAMLNDGLEEVCKRIEPITVATGIPIVSANTNMVAFPLDVERIRDANYSTGNPALGGSIVYELVQLDYDSFIQETDSTPAGGIGGIPTIYSLTTDASGVQLMQFYPFANTGQINLHYYKRPTLWTSTPASLTDLDSLWQEAVILYACSQAGENREDYQVSAKYFFDKFEAEVERNMGEQKRRSRKRGTNTVRDVSIGSSTVPTWMH